MLLLSPCLAALIAVAPSATGSGQDRRIPAFGPPPSWVVKLSLDDAPGPSKDDAEDGVLHRLSDRQTRVGAATVERFVHTAAQVISSTGVQEESQISIGFDPSYEKLVLHFVRIRRGKQVRDALRPAAVRVLDQEKDFQRRLYDGRLTAALLLEDVRVGDVIEVAYSVDGANPVLAGRYAATFMLGFGVPVGRVYQRLLVPVARDLAVRSVHLDAAPAVKVTNAVREYVWDRTSTKAVARDDHLPSWFNPFPRVEVSEFKGWDEVARWAVPLFRAPQPASPALTSLAARWKALPEEDRALAALRFVREEVRYFGVEMGINTHVPHAPAEVIAHRYGDCKDKAFLLASLLAQLGIEARPALVNTRARQSLDEWLPSPLAFDHAIVRARVAGREYWLDATASDERGRLDALPPATERRALVVDPGTRALTEIPAPGASEPLMTIEEVYDARDEHAPARLRVTTRYVGSEAARMRGKVASESASQLSRWYLNYYAKADPSIEASHAPKLTDDTDKNRLTIEEEYRIPDFWRAGERRFSSEEIVGFLDKPQIALRSMPLSLSHPVHVVEVMRAQLPRGSWNLRSSRREVKSAAFAYSREVDFAGDELSVRREYQSLADAIEPNDVAEHLRKLDEVREVLGVTVELPRDSVDGVVAASAFVPGEVKRNWLVSLGIFGAVVLAVSGWKIAGTLPGRVRRNRFRRKSRLTRGEGPAFPLMLDGREDLENHLRSMRCGCGYGLVRTSAAADDPAAVLGGHAVLAARLSCRHCGTVTTLYYGFGTADA
jgi:transglutaminase-like putative cysteine protease